jgi:integrase
MARIVERISSGLIKIGRVYYSDIRISGKRIQRALSTDRRIAEGKLSDLYKERNAKKHKHVTQDASWENFKRRFLADRGTKAKTTFNHYNRLIKDLESTRPITRLSQITPGLLADISTEWKINKRGLYARNKDIQNIKAMMRIAEGWGLIDKQDWDSIKRDKEPKGRLLWYTADQLAHLLKVCRGTWKTIALLGARAGLRRSEMYWLSWADIDLERNRLHVSPKDGWNPKDFERRWIPLSSDLREHLQSIIRAGEWVIEDRDGRPTPGAMTTYFRRLLRKVSLKGSIHSLRHTFGSHLASAGVSPYIIQKLMGHSKVNMTEIYMHLAPEALQNAITFLPPIKKTKRQPVDEKLDDASSVNGSRTRITTGEALTPSEG